MSTQATKTASREIEGRQTTSIRPVSLRRAQIVVAMIPNENITDFVSNSVDERVRALLKKHKLTLPNDVSFTTGQK